MPNAKIDLEVEYNNRARVPDHGTYIAAWHADSAAYRECARCELDLAYGPGQRHRVDLFHTEGEEIGPVVLYIHGGYWQALDKSSSSHLARGPNKRGLTVAVPSYDLAPDATVADIVDAIENAADFVAEHTGRALVVTGHSAGGHLAACLMARPVTASRRPIRAGMPISGLFDLEPLVPTSLNRALGLTIAEARRLSPLHWMPPPQGRLVAVVGDTESSEFLRQSAEIVDVWGAAGVDTRVHVVPGAHHFDVMAGLSDPADPLVETLVALAADA